MCFLVIWSIFFKKMSVQFTDPFHYWDFFRSLVFWAPHIVWLLIPCQLYSWKSFSPILWTASLIWLKFLLLYRSFLV
jgi:hypothetical protein